MNVNRLIKVPEGDALRALRVFLMAWWRRYNLAAMLAPVEVASRSTVFSQVLTDPAALNQVNPFAPIMLNNAVAALSEFAQRHAGRRMAALLRPCELRTLSELRAQGRLPPEVSQLITLSVDCLGTYATDEYNRQVQMYGLSGLTRDILTNANEGGFTTPEFRTACQVCASPAPRGADITIGVLGVNSTQYLLIIARDETVDADLLLDKVTAGFATEPYVARREMTIGQIADEHVLARARLAGDGHGARHFSDLGRALSWFTNCSLCGDCLDACPLYNGELSGMLGVHGARPALAEMVDVGRWLAACSGCGMCEAACEQSVPLMSLVSSLSYEIQNTLHHTAGDAFHPLPWAQAELTPR